MFVDGLPSNVKGRFVSVVFPDEVSPSKITSSIPVRHSTTSHCANAVLTSDDDARIVLGLVIAPTWLKPNRRYRASYRSGHRLSQAPRPSSRYSIARVIAFGRRSGPQSLVALHSRAKVAVVAAMGSTQPQSALGLLYRRIDRGRWHG
jgi:hypothetical protein